MNRGETMTTLSARIPASPIGPTWVVVETENLIDVSSPRPVTNAGGELCSPVLTVGFAIERNGISQLADSANHAAGRCAT
jgi:hypothetical protein